MSDRLRFDEPRQEVHAPYLAAPGRYAGTEYRRAGRSGLLLPPISLGLWYNFGDDRPFALQREVVRHAFDRGITHFDLANNYGPPRGSAEENFGRIVAKDLRPYRAEILISTKAGFDMHPGPYGEWGGRKYLLDSLDASLHRLGLDHVDIFYSHRPDPATPIEETVAALDAAVRSGKTRYVALSNYDAGQTLAAHAAAAELGLPLVLHQPRYSMLDRRFEPELQQAVADTGLGVITYSTLSQGLLTDRYLAGRAVDRAAERPFFDPVKAAEDATVARLQGIAAVAKARGQSLAQLALAWVLANPQVTSALIGASRIEQLDENLAALDAPPLTAEELAELDRFAAAKGEFIA